MMNEKLQSDTIDFLRFPLIIGVVLIHSQINQVTYNGVNVIGGVEFPLYKFLSHLISHICSSIAVPLFFFISGFLFFKRGSFSFSIYGDKLKKRVKTLLVPYVIWNLVTILLFFLLQKFLLGLSSGLNKLIVDYTFYDWISAFWNINQFNQPIAYQFWFIRDLMVVILFSPLVFVVVRYLSIFGLFGLGSLWMLNYWFTLSGFSITAFFFFSSGAWFSIYKSNFIVILKPFLPYSIIGCCVLIGLDFCLIDSAWLIYIHNIRILVGCVFAITLSAYMLDLGKWRAKTYLIESCFFIYAYHAMFLALMIKVLIYVLRPQTDIAIVFVYLLCPVIIIMFGVLIYRFLKKNFPTFTAVITGGR